MSTHIHPSSFKDPDGSVFSKNQLIYRLIYDSYKIHYDKLVDSGLYQELITKLMLIPHLEVADTFSTQLNTEKPVYKILQPELIPFISYPYEWSFSQLKNAALLTLDIQLKALEKGMSLKDASAYNVQFNGIDPVFIDTSSFEIYNENTPWQAYGQFCRHFLGPLLLWVHRKRELSKLSSSYLDGIPLHVISYSLPYKTKYNFFIFSHIHYHAKLEAKHAGNKSLKEKVIAISKNRLVGLITHLRNGIEKLTLDKQTSEWSGYYDTFSYDKTNFSQKQICVSSFIDSIKPQTLLDIGCNEGEFSILCSQKVKQIVAVDFDQLVINNLYQKLVKQQIKNILPLVLDITNPSPGIGLGNEERSAFLKRGNYDMALALALIHHLAIGNNMPLEICAGLFASVSNKLIIEFVPKEDPQAQRLLITKKDIFTTYNLQEFIKSFSCFFQITEQRKLENSGRVLFLMKKHA